MNMPSSTANPQHRTRHERIAFAVVLAVAAIALAPRPAGALQIEAMRRDRSRADTQLVRATYHQIEVAIHDQIAASTHSFQIRNDDTGSVELTCSFQLAGNEMVDGFAYWNGSEKIVGEVLPKADARRIYDGITGLRRDPGILEKVGSVFRFQVFPVEPGETKPVELTTVVALEQRDGAVEYRIPRQNLPAAGAVFSLKIDITDDLPLALVETAGFVGRVNRLGPRHWQVVAETAEPTFDSDLVVRYQVATDDHAVRLLTHRTAGEDGAFMLLVTPKVKVDADEVLGRDVVFVVDVSGSMNGEPIQQTRAALVATLGQLRPTDRFDVLAFNDRVRPFFASLQSANEVCIAEALERVRALDAIGGTDIDGALESALRELADAQQGRPRAVVFLTDGQGSTPPEVTLAKVAAAARGARIYALGAGQGVNRSFLARLAHLNRGTATFMQTSTEIERDVSELWERIGAPLMVDLTVEFDGLNVNTTYPKELPDLYRDGQVLVFGRYASAGHGLVRVSGTVKGERRVVTIAADLPEVEPHHAAIEKLWASSRIEALTELIGQRRDDELVAEVTRLGIVYNIATDYTSFVAIPESEKTREVRDQLERATEGATRTLIDTMADLRLSMTNIPPGDPVLSVQAPREAKKVVAYFPFGLVKELRFDPTRLQWSCRFLVPRGVKDGVYTIRVQVIHSDDRIEWREIQYTIDSTAPEFAASVPDRAAPGSTVTLSVDPFEQLQEAVASIPGSATGAVPLVLDTASGRYIGALPVPADLHGDTFVVRILLRDLARNRCQRDFKVRVDAAPLGPAAPAAAVAAR